MDFKEIPMYNHIMQALNHTISPEITSTITGMPKERAVPHGSISPPDTSYLEALAQVAAMKRMNPIEQGLLLKGDQGTQSSQDPSKENGTTMKLERADIPSPFFTKVKKIKTPYYSALKVDPAPRPNLPGLTPNIAASQHSGSYKKARIDDFCSNQAFGVLIITKPESQPGTIGPYNTYLFNPQIVAAWVNINNYSGIKAIAHGYGGQSLKNSPHKVIYNAYEVSVCNSYKKSFYETERKNLNNSFWVEPQSGNEFLTYTATWGP